MCESYPKPLVKRVILAFLLGGLVVLSYVVLRLFLVQVLFYDVVNERTVERTTCSFRSAAFRPVTIMSLGLSSAPTN